MSTSRPFSRLISTAARLQNEASSSSSSSGASSTSAMSNAFKPFLERQRLRNAAAAFNAGREGMNVLEAASSRYDNRPTETQGRQAFSDKKFITPDHVTRSSLYDARRPFPRPPLLGPKRRDAKKIDPFYLSNSSPLDHTLNPRFGLAFVNQMGRIKSRAETGLTWKSQRMVGKLIRRQRAMGIIGQWSSRASPRGYGAEVSEFGYRDY